VQVDAVVIDNKGRLVKDLVAGDFEIRQDGRLRKISGVSVCFLTKARRIGWRCTVRSSRNYIATGKCIRRAIAHRWSAG